MSVEGTRLRGAIFKWSSSYGFATAIMGQSPVDIFVHKKNFIKKRDRDTIQQHGLDGGEHIVFDVKKPRKPGKSSYEAANVVIVDNRGGQEEASDDPNPQVTHIDPTDTRASCSTGASGMPEQHELLEKRIADLHNSWARCTAADLSDDDHTHGTLFMGYIYVFQLNKHNNTLEQGQVGQLTCREGSATYRIIQFIDGIGDTFDKLESGHNTKCRIYLDSDIFMENGMPFACRHGGSIIAEGSVTEVLRHGQAQ